MNDAQRLAAIALRRGWITPRVSPDAQFRRVRDAQLAAGVSKHAVRYETEEQREAARRDTQNRTRQRYVAMGLRTDGVPRGLPPVGWPKGKPRKGNGGAA